MSRVNVIRTLIFLATSVGAWALLSLSGGDQTGLRVGSLATRDYVARTSAEVVNEAETELARQAAADAVENELSRDEGAEEAGFAAIESILGAVARGVVDPALPVPGLRTPEQAAPTTAGASTTAGTSVSTTVSGQIFLDGNGDDVFTSEQGSVDRGIRAVSVLLFNIDGVQIGIAETQSDGTWQAQLNAIPAWAAVDGLDPEFPSSLTLIGENDLQEVFCEEGVCTTAVVGYEPAVRSPQEQIDQLLQSEPSLGQTTAETLVFYATGDVLRAAVGEPSWLQAIGAGAQAKLTEVFGEQVTSENFSQVRGDILANQPLVLIGATPDPAARAAAADIASEALRPNYVFDPDETEQARQEARDAVDPIMESFIAGERIALESQVLDQVMIDAIDATGAASSAETGRSAGLLAVLIALVASIGFYLSRFRQEIWSRPRMAALLGLLIVLAAGAVRLTIEVQSGVDEVAAWYLIPTVVFGLMAAVLFDSRVAAVMALAMAVLVASGTRDPGLATYAAMSTMVPVGFVSSLSARGAYRKAVIASAISVGALAAAVAWFFHVLPDQDPWQTVGGAAALAAGISVVSALVGLAALQFFESAFDITSNLRLLELTDRNHDALVLLQEKAFGTFNHSLMVGTLADAAARAVGANPLLARAAAYYHDLGKTANPTFFIENQFGASNPHDDLEPRQSVELIRQHVTEGVRLARKYRIPTEVTEAIVTHHGDGIMRYFYEKARRSEGDEAIDPSDFRHVGHKPRSAEMAIVMLSDSLEAACRAVFQEEEPTPDRIEKVVSRVVDEKVNDGQLSECSLTLGQLTRARRAFLEALVGHYHQRIQYPNFPGA